MPLTGQGYSPWVLKNKQTNSQTTSTVYDQIHEKAKWHVVIINSGVQTSFTLSSTEQNIFQTYIKQGRFCSAN